jgi:hypothetical protein
MLECPLLRGSCCKSPKTLREYFFREKTKPATIADQCSLKPVTGIARELDAW